MKRLQENELDTVFRAVGITSRILFLESEMLRRKCLHMCFISVSHFLYNKVFPAFCFQNSLLLLLFLILTAVLKSSTFFLILELKVSAIS